MSIGVQAFRGERLTQARLARGLYKNALADMVGITGTAITRYEEGVDKPQAERLVALASNLNFPVEFFFQPELAEAPSIIFWRSRAAETKLAREMTQQRILWSCEIFSVLEREVDFPSVKLPNVSAPADFRQLTPELIELCAERLREAWRLWDRPIPDMTLALENAGFPVVHLEIASDKQDGFCFPSMQLGRFFVGINTYNVSSARTRYDAAHELGHIVLHSHVTLQQSRDPALFKLIEQQAHRFAGAFLFPREAFRREVGAVTLDYFASLKRRWGMSIAAMVYRASDLMMVDDEERGVLYRNLTRRQWRGPLQEPFDHPRDMPLERPRMLRRGLEVMLSEGSHARFGIQRALPLPDRELEQIIGLDPGYLRSAEVTPLVVTRRASVGARDLESGEVIEFAKHRKQ